MPIDIVVAGGVEGGVTVPYIHNGARRVVIELSVSRVQARVDDLGSLTDSFIQNGFEIRVSAHECQP